MILLYEVANALEAHMILNLLEQQGLSGRIDGEYLQGGFGELPAVGIRIMVEEKDYAAAKKIIDEWDRKQPAENQKSSFRRIHFGSALVGLLLGASATAIYLHVPIYYDGVDHNGDGKLDETWKTLNYKISETKVDRNFDGKIDYIIHYNRNSNVDFAESDDDFNGKFETYMEYKNGNVRFSKSDTQDIGIYDYIVGYKDGVLETETFIDIVSAKPVKVNYYEKLRLVKSEIDSNNDGKMDLVYEYDKIGEIIKRYNK